MENFGSTDEFSDALRDENQNESNSKVWLILKYMLEREYLERSGKITRAHDRRCCEICSLVLKKNKEIEIMYLGMYPIDIQQNLWRDIVFVGWEIGR